MRLPNRFAFPSVLFLTTVSLTLGQSLKLSKEYIRLNGQIVAIENAPPSGPNVQLSPTTLTFGSQNVGSSSAGQAVTLTNSGNAALPITSTSLTISGANYTEFSSTNNCGTSLAAGGSCTVTVTFTPAATGNRTATLAIAGVAQMVSLSGTGANLSPIVSLSAASLAFGSQAPGTPSFNQNLTLTNTGTVDLVFGGLPTLGGSNPGDFTVSGTNCEPQFAPLRGGASCTVVVNFTPQFSGARSATLTFTDNASPSTQTVTLSGTGSGAAAPSLTTYLGTYGSAASPLSGPAAMLPIRAYYSGGAAQINYVQTALSSGYNMLAKQNLSGGYFLSVYNNSGAYVTIDPLTASGNTVILPSPLVVGSMKLTAYRFALAGNEFQLDLSLTRSDSFNDQIVIWAVLPNDTGYSNPWMAADGQWSSSTAAGSTCNGANIQGSILMGAGSWQCWQGSQLNTSNYGNPFWNGNSGDGNQSGIGWLMVGNGGQNSLSVSAPGALGYFGSAGGGGAGNSLYFASTGASVTVSRIAQLTNGAGVNSVGWYSIDPNNPNTAPTAATMHALVSYTVAATTFQPTPYYGLYLSGPSGTFYFTQPRFNQVNVDGLQHFAVFQQSASSYYIGVEDTGKTESDLDYNDMVIQLTVGGTSAAPAVSIAAPAQGATVSGTVTVSATAISAVGLASVQFLLDGANLGSVVTGSGPTFTTQWNTAGTANGSHTLSAVATDTQGRQTTSAGVGVTVSNAVSGASAVFQKTDTTTAGNWKGVYGADGSMIPNDSTHIPSYAGVTVGSTANTYTWITSTSDARALLKYASTTDRISSTYYNYPNFTIDVNFTDGLTHQIALYLSDWDSQRPSETITILDAGSNAALDTRSVSSFSTVPRYLVWNVRGHVLVQAAVPSTSINAIINGVFFDPVGGGSAPAVSVTAPAAGATVSSTVTVSATASSTVGLASVQFLLDGANLGNAVTGGGPTFTTQWNTASAANGNHTLSAKATDTQGRQTTSAGVTVTVANAAAGGATATYAGSDTTTKGTWTGKYGADGQSIANGLSNLPVYASMSIINAATYTWAGTTDLRALQVASGSTTRIASVYYSSSNFTIDLNLTDGNAHKISLYLCDWDAYGRAETISITDAASGAVLDSETFSSFVNGTYASWVIKGHVKMQVTRTASVNGVVNGIFFDAGG
jgi:hypothetical protein